MRSCVLGQLGGVKLARTKNKRREEKKERREKVCEMDGTPQRILMPSDTDAVQGQGKQAKRAPTTDEHTPLRVPSRGVHFLPSFFC